MALLNPETDAAEAAHLIALPRTSTRMREANSAPADGAAEYAAALHQLDLGHRKLRTGFADHLGLTHNEYDAFMFITESQTTTPKDLAATLRFTTGATTAMIDRLENVDLVHRIPNPGDRRSVLLEPTPHGETQAAWVISNYIRIANDAVTSHTTLTAQALTDAISHITTIITNATEQHWQQS
ncbi:hypothetical protein B7R22_14380 [Subtercola boreus]|uniref:HTH marR-type domain-containing protein n=1 Tax=Subtercola boreus TaxID=120213 RepID=A0A3E0VW72_9MICO|nr:MarR family winged helix-turn-helix transcriptional regulator [Subtercola boreus]RFA13097.1 hypothetical protein B7R22_14380 [Subtercola boreus]